MELLQIKCPTCHATVLQSHTTYGTQYHGRRILYKCAHCPPYFSETKKTLMAGWKTPISVIWQGVKARTEGRGFNAAARPFEQAKHTILAWERKFRDLHQVLCLYALVHEFLA
jgi:transposase-like protein